MFPGPGGGAESAEGVEGEEGGARGGGIAEGESEEAFNRGFVGHFGFSFALVWFGGRVACAGMVRCMV